MKAETMTDDDRRRVPRPSSAVRRPFSRESAGRAPSIMAMAVAGRSRKEADSRARNASAVDVERCAGIATTRVVSSSSW